MAEWLDPNQPLVARQRQVAERKALALAKAKKAAQEIGVDSPQGQMVGRFYVPPAASQQWAAALRPTLENLFAQVNMADAKKAEDAYTKDEQAAATAHMQAQPKPTEPFQAPGIDAQDAANVSIGTSTLKTPQQMAREKGEWAQKGQAIPSLRDTMTKLYEDQLINEPVRQEARGEKRLDREDRQTAAREAQAAALQARIEEARLRAEDRAADRASREQAAREMRELQRQLAGIASADRRYAADTAAGARRDATAAAAANKPVPVGVVNKLGDLEEKASTFGRLHGSFQDEFGGVRGAVTSAAGSYVPGVDTDSSNWWKDYKRNNELIERHELFGAALTPGEQASWKAATISPGMKPEAIRENLKRQQELSQKVFERARDRYGRAGYNVEGAFPKGEAQQGGGGSEWDAPPVSIKGDTDFAKLPSGARYVGPDGVTRTKR